MKTLRMAIEDFEQLVGDAISEAANLQLKVGFGPLATVSLEIADVVISPTFHCESAMDLQHGVETMPQ